MCSSRVRNALETVVSTVPGPLVCLVGIDCTQCLFNLSFWGLILIVLGIQRSSGMLDTYSATELQPQPLQLELSCRLSSTSLVSPEEFWIMGPTQAHQWHSAGCLDAHNQRGTILSQLQYAQQRQEILKPFKSSNDFWCYRKVPSDTLIFPNDSGSITSCSIISKEGPVSKYANALRRPALKVSFQAQTSLLNVLVFRHSYFIILTCTTVK